MATDIDFNAGLSLEDVETQATLGTDKSTWVKTLTALYEGVREGRGEYGTFYKVGNFKNPSGAQTAIRNIKDNFADRLPASFDLRPVVKPNPEDSTKRVSFLWAAVIEPEDDEEYDEVDEDLDDTGDDDTGVNENVEEDVEETPAPAKSKARGRK